MKTYRIAAIPGDGIGTEVVSAGVEVLHALAKREGKLRRRLDRLNHVEPPFWHDREAPDVRSERAGT